MKKDPEKRTPNKRTSEKPASDTRIRAVNMNNIPQTCDIPHQNTAFCERKKFLVV